MKYRTVAMHTSPEGHAYGIATMSGAPSGSVTIGPDGARTYRTLDGSELPADLRPAFDEAVQAWEPVTPHAEYVAAHGYAEGVGAYLLTSDGFRADARPGPQEGLGRAWLEILEDLLRAGQMRRSQTGRFWWT